MKLKVFFFCFFLKPSESYCTTTQFFLSFVTFVVVISRGVSILFLFFKVTVFYTFFCTSYMREVKMLLPLFFFSFEVYT